MASEASQNNFGKFAILDTKYEQIAKLEHFFYPGGGGGAQTHLCPPSFESACPHFPIILRYGFACALWLYFHCCGHSPLQYVAR